MKSACSSLALLPLLSGGILVPVSASTDGSFNKQMNLSPPILSKIVTTDITERQALITADFTRSVYAESATFQDEIDTYTLDKYIKGTKALFNAAQSHVDLVGEVVTTNEAAIFRFKEVLAFNIPFNPKVRLSGRVELTRDPKDGLFVKSREYWDQSIGEVLRTIYF